MCQATPRQSLLGEELPSLPIKLYIIVPFEVVCPLSPSRITVSSFQVDGLMFQKIPDMSRYFGPSHRTICTLSTSCWIWLSLYSPCHRTSIAAQTPRICQACTWKLTSDPDLYSAYLHFSFHTKIYFPNCLSPSHTYDPLLQNPETDALGVRFIDCII